MTNLSIRCFGKAEENFIKKEILIMLILFQLPGSHILALNSYGKLYNHLENLERGKGKGKWIFARHSHQRMLSLYRYIRNQKIKIFEESLGEILTEATNNTIEKEGCNNPDILEIIKGNIKKPVFIPVTSDVDVGALQKQWCQNYCKSHGFILFEINGPTDFKGIGGGHDSVA
jgi:hypothetical protein